MKSHIIKVFVGAILIWLLFLGVRSVFPSLNTNTVGEADIQANIENSFAELEKRLELASDQIHYLTRNNAKLKRIIGAVNSNPASKPVGLIVSLAGEKKETLPEKGEPRYAYEKTRHRLELDMKEMWYTIRGHASSIGRKDFEQIQDIYRLLTSHLLKLRQQDGYELFRERETKELSRIMQKRLRDLQNPPDCASAKKLVCSIHGECGFGCQIHYVAYCMIEAFATGRTLILESKGWKYNRDGWDTVFLPVSDNCTSFNNGSVKTDWKSKNQNQHVQVLALPWKNFSISTPYLPMTIPFDIASRLERVHGAPQAWWVGQFVMYLLRFQPQTQAFLDDAKKKMGITTPIVGVQVRRTDKLRREAKFHSLKEYMDHAEEYFSIREKTEVPVRRRVFIASDDPNVIVEAEKTFNGTEWQIMSDMSVAQSASLGNRYRGGLFAILRDIFLMSECDYVVCTFTSNVCRLAYELSQSKYADASGRFVSLDDIYYFWGGENTIKKVQFIHKPRASGELELAVGDKIEEARNNWNGLSMGTNHRTKKTGLYPSYKTRN